MKKFFYLIFAAAWMLVSCGGQNVDLTEVPLASEQQLTRVEPPCWWVGMKTELQLLVCGPGIGEATVEICGGKGVSVAAVHKADSKDYLFVDVTVSPKAADGEYMLLFTMPDGTCFKHPYNIARRREGSAQRTSFTTADAIYLLMPDRFSNGCKENDNTDDTTEKADYDAFFGRYGGDIKGIENHLDYIADLGMTAVWPTPLLEDNQPEGSYHGYACTDYYNIDSRFGSNEDYRALVQTMHGKGLKMIMDCVPNHCGLSHWWMENLPFEDWVHVWPEYTHSNCAFSMQNDPYASKRDKENMEGGWFDTSMPDMNLDNPYVLQYFKQWAVWWIEYADLDGFRVDTYPYNEKYPMAQWCASVRREYPNINIVGEVWSVNVPQVAYWQADNPNRDGFNSNLPSIMDFCLHSAICSSINTASEHWDEGITKVYDCIANDFYLNDVDNLMIFPGNHDTDRIGDVIGGDPAKLKEVMAMMATLRGYPQIFSGDELLVRSRDLTQGHGGLRVMFPEGWASDPVMKDCHDYCKALFQWRKTSDAVQHGKTLHFLSRSNTYAYFRYTDTQTVFVFVNNRETPSSIPWADYSEIAENLPAFGKDVVTGTLVNPAEAVVPAKSALVLEYK